MQTLPIDKSLMLWAIEAAKSACPACYGLINTCDHADLNGDAEFVEGCLKCWERALKEE